MFSRRKGAKAGRVLFFGISTFFVLFWGVYLAFGNKEEGDIGFVSYSKEKSLVIDQDTEWKKNEARIIKQSVVVESGATLTIEKGSVVKFEKKKGENPPFILIKKGGTIYATGTEEEKIKFTSDQENSNFSIILDGFNNGQRLSGFFKYVEFSNAGGVFEKEQSLPEDSHQSYLPLVNRAKAEEATIIEETRYPIHHLGGSLWMQNCSFLKNKTPDVYISDKEIDFNNLTPDQGSLVRIVNSNFKDNDFGIAVGSDYECEAEDSSLCKNLFWLKNNWYDSDIGPDIVKNKWSHYNNNQSLGNSPSGHGEKVVGENIEVDGFRRRDLITDPLIVIPGIMGSSEKMTGNELVLDPITHSYKDLLNSLKNNGYEEGRNLFTFPYDWRNSNVMTAQKLANKVLDIYEETGLYSFDIVAHSMGGLVARQYIQGEGSAWVDQLITLGTPHRGAPKAYLMWEAGEGFFTWRENLLKHHFAREAKHNDYNNLYSYIRKEVLSVKELLPDYNYLYDIKKDQLRNYSNQDNYPINSFLENLNKNIDSKENFLQELGGVDFYNIIGETEREKTITQIKIDEIEDKDIWEHGKPENFEDESTDRGLVFGEGDETVPFESANGIIADKTFKLESTHTDLPTKSQCHVFKKLTGKEFCEYSEKFHFPNILLFNVYSPIDIQVVSPSGKKIGKDFDSGEMVNEIDLAYYSGFDTEEEFITIPNYEKGEYQIKTQGTGEGEYTVEVASFEKGDKEEESKERIVQTVEGEASAGETKSFLVNIQSSEGGDNEQEEENKKDENGKEDGNDEDDDQSSATGDQDASSENFDSDEDEDEDENNESSGIEDQSNDNENSDSDEDSDEDEDGDDEKNEDDQSSGISHQVASAEKEMNSDQSSVIRDQEDKTEEESVAKKKDENSINFSEKENKQEKPAVKGQSTRNNPLVIAGMFFAGAVALTLTWTVGRGKKGESNPS